MDADTTVPGRMRLMLDENLSPVLAETLARSGIDAVALQAWEDGRLMGAPDDEILESAVAAGSIFVTADQVSIVALLRRWAGEERTHAGVIIVTRGETERRSIGGVVRTLTRLVGELREADWTNRVAYLPRQ